MERYIPVAQTQRLVIVLVSRMQKIGDKLIQYQNGKVTFSVRPTEMTGPFKVDHLQSWSRIFR